MKYLILFLFLSNANAYTLNNNFGAAFDKNSVKVAVAGNSVCSNAGITAEELLSLVKPALNNFWNEVPTSKLRLKTNGMTDEINNIIDGRLCAPTDDECLDDAASHGDTVVPPVNDIVISCNRKFENFGDSSVIAVTVPNNFKGRNIRGSVILINDTSNTFGNLSRSDKISVIAHEIGHAFGLGHSEDKAALMYYKTVNLRRNLGQDDVDGVSYLYPVHLDGCGLFGATVKNISARPGPPMWQMALGFFLLLILARLRKLLYRA